MSTVGATGSCGPSARRGHGKTIYCDTRVVTPLPRNTDARGQTRQCANNTVWSRAITLATRGTDQDSPKGRFKPPTRRDFPDAVSIKSRPDVLFVTASAAWTFSAESQRAKRTFGCRAKGSGRMGRTPRRRRAMVWRAKTKQNPGVRSGHSGDISLRLRPRSQRACRSPAPAAGFRAESQAFAGPRYGPLSPVGRIAACRR